MRTRGGLTFHGNASATRVFTWGSRELQMLEARQCYMCGSVHDSLS